MKKRAFFAGFVVGTLVNLFMIFAGLLVFLCPSVNTALVNRLLFIPIQQFDEEDKGQCVLGCNAKDVFFKTSDGETLHGRLYPNDGAHQIIMYSHGQCGNVSLCASKIENLLKTGASVFAYDYRGYGKSTGTPTARGAIADARSAFDYLLKNTPYKGWQIILYGESLGTGITSSIAEGLDCGGIVLESAFISPEILGKEMFPIVSIYPSFLFPSPDLSNERMVKGKHAPLLLVAATRDKMIPSQHSQYLFDRASEPKAIALFEKSRHAHFGADKTKFESRLRAFLKECDERTQHRFAIKQK